MPADAKLAQRLGFSHITLGRALNELRKLDVVERSRARGTSIVPNFDAKQVPKAQVVAILFDDLNPATFNSGLLQQFYQRLTQKEYNILFFSAGNSGQEQAEQLMDLMKRRQCAGAIVWSIMNREQVESVMAVKPAFWPLVFVNTLYNPADTPADTVVFDNCGGCREIALQYWRNTGHKVIFSTHAQFLDASLHKEYLDGMRKAVGEENVQVFLWDRDPISQIINRKEHSLLLCFKGVQSIKELHGISRIEEISPCVFSRAEVEPPPDDGIPYLFSSLTELARTAVELLDRRIKSPQCAYHHELTSYHLLNMERLFADGRASRGR